MGRDTGVKAEGVSAADSGWYREAAMLGAEEVPRTGGLARSSGVVALWAAVVGVLAAVVLIAAAVVGDLDAAPPWRAQAEDGDWGTLENAGAEGSAELDSDQQVIRLAGSGSNLPLTREIAEAFMRRFPSKRVIVFESVGSTGGVRAVSDGVVDLGLVSRPLRPAEDGLGLVVIPYARVAVAAVANLDVPESGLRRRELVDVYAGERRRWGNDAPIVVLQRERGDSSHEAVDRALPEFAAVNDAAYRQERWRVVYNDRAMYEALVSTPGSIGLLDVGATQTQALALKVLELDGVRPTEANLRSGRYPFAKDLSFISVEQPAGLAAEFVEFIRSSDGQALIRQRGYVPLTAASQSSGAGAGAGARGAP